MTKKILKKLSLALIFIGATSVSAQLVDFGTDLDGWDVSYGTNGAVTHDDTEGVAGDGALKLERSTNNANFGVKGTAATELAIDADVKKVVRIRYKNETKGTQLRISGKNSDDVTIKNNEGGNIDTTIGAESDEYVTSYIDLSSYTLWSGTLLNFHILVRQNTPDDSGKAFYLDEIEFLDAMPATTYSEFIQNPSFEGPTGDSFLTGTKAFATRGITSTEFKDGTNSLRVKFIADQDETFWTFSNYDKVYDTEQPSGSTSQVKLWVKTNRASTILVNARIKYTKSDGVTVHNSTLVSKETTNTSMGWEELTYDFESTDTFKQANFRFAIAYVDGVTSTDLKTGDMVYFDQFSATLEEPTLSVSSTTKIEGAKVIGFNGTIQVSGATLDGVYSITGQAIENSNLTSGVYIVKISNGELQETLKVVL